MKALQPISLLAVLICTFQSGFAQSGTDDFMRSTGKIYVVVAVIVVMFIGLIVFLFNMDKKLTRLENQIKNNE